MKERFQEQKRSDFMSKCYIAVFSYIMEKGIEFIKQITDEDIEEIKDNGICSAEFNRSLVRCARRICNECELIEIVEFIRLHLWCTPTVHDVYLYREDYTEETFAELLNDLDLDESEVENEIKLFVVVDEEWLRKEDK